MAAQLVDVLLGEIRLFAGTFTPEGWLDCDGKLLEIKTHMALFAILSTTYGGDGLVNFRLPDLQGRTPLGIGRGDGLSNVNLGEKGGAEISTRRAGKP